MVKIQLEISMKLENLMEVKPKVGKSWFFKCKCNSCQEVSDKWHYASTDEDVMKSQGRGTANFVYKCSNCKREATLRILEDTIKSFKFDQANEDGYQPLVVFDCRGLELTEIDPRDEWTASSETKLFDEVAFDGTEWSDYNDRTKEPVSILEFRYQFKKA